MIRVAPDRRLESIDSDALRRVFLEHPVRLAIVFGSHVRGTAHSTSDVDLAIEFDDSVSDQEYAEARLRLIADVSSAFGQNAVDVADLRDMAPSIGQSALEHGVVIVGNPERAEQHLERFTETAASSDRSRRERFDEILERTGELV